jgi:hypothetical protein
MPDWQERVTRESEPAIRAEHELRYGLAAPLMAGAALWCDLGCGSGVAAASALEGREPPARIVLVDVAEDALEDARRELRVDDALTLRADLSNADDVARVRAALLEQAPGAGTRCITCFETIEHLASFVPLVELLVELAEQHGFTVVASVPNDAFWSLENPHHRTMWGEGAFEELRRLLPADHGVLRQVPLQGSAVVPEEAQASFAAEVHADADGVPSHFLVVFGAERARVAGGVRVVQADLEEQRRWERQRESDLPYLQAEVSAMWKEFNDWRAYIHDLERQLGLPLSGVEAGDEPPAGSANGASAEAEQQREGRIPTE